MSGPKPEGSLRARTVATLDRYIAGGRVTNDMAGLLREWLRSEPAPAEAVRARLRALTCVQAGWAFGVPEDGRAQWLDLVAAAMSGPEPVEAHDYDDDGTDPGNCRVCHFYHREPRGPRGEVLI